MRYSSTFTALYDANVLYSNSLRDLLMRLALTDLFRAKWTEDIQHEWTRNLQANRPDIPSERLERLKQLMNEHVRDAIVNGYQDLIPALTGLPDLNDRHVLAGAIVGRADVIVTYNIKDFPASVLDRYDIEAQHPDEFIRHLIGLNESKVCGAIREMRAALKNPALSIDEFLDSFLRAELSLTVAALRDLRDLI